MKPYSDAEQHRGRQHTQMADAPPPDFDVAETKAMIERGYRRFCKARGLNFESETFEGRRRGEIREAQADKDETK